MAEASVASGRLDALVAHREMILIGDPGNPVAEVSISSRPRVVIVVDHPAQHFIESYRCVAESTQVDSSILYWTENAEGHYDKEFGQKIRWDMDLLSGYRWYRPEGTNSVRRVASFIRLIQTLRPQVVVCFGWGTLIARLAILWSVVNRTHLLFFGDATWQHHESTGGRSALRRILLQTAFRLAAGALSTGTFNREFYIHLGMHPEHVFESVYPIDLASYSAARNKRGGKARGTTTVGFAGKLIPRKGVDELLRALGMVSHDERWEARIVGDGPDRERLQALSHTLGIARRVHFAGFRNVSEMPAELAGMDILVVPSTRDMRVLVATEAMATGAAVIVSSNTAVWGRGDIVEDGVTGMVYRSGRPDELAKIIEELINNPTARAALQAAATQRAMGQSPEAFTKGLERAVAAVLRG